MVGRLKGGAEIRVKLCNDEELKLQLDPEITIARLKDIIYCRNSILPRDCMCLTYAGVFLKNENKVKYYKFGLGATIFQSKSDLSEIPGLIISYEPDILSFDDSKEARAKMVCGHVISTESMT
jgi:Ubiquitin family